MEQTKEMILSPKNLPYYSTVVTRQERDSLSNVTATQNQTENRARLKMPISSKTNLLRSLCFAFWVMLGLVFVTGCEDIGNIDIVKRSVLRDLDDTLSIGNAFDKYEYFTKTEWTEFKTAQGRKIVEVIGYYKKLVEGFVRVQFMMNDGLRKDRDGNRFKMGYIEAGLRCGCLKGVKGDGGDGIITKIWKNDDVGSYHNDEFFKRGNIGDVRVVVDVISKLCDHNGQVVPIRMDEY